MVSLDDEFEITNGVNVGGRFINNANGEYCGGTFREAFAESCNADFAPLGPEDRQRQAGRNRRALRLQLAADPLRAARSSAEVEPPESTIPTEIGEELDLGVSAIGQGEVLATPLEMASVAQTIGNDGVRQPTSIVANKKLRPDAEPVRVMSKKIAGELTELMIGVVTERHRHRRGDPRGPGRRQDRHRRARPEARPGERGKPGPDQGRLVRRLRPGRKGEAGGRGAADRSRSRRRRSRRPGRLAKSSPPASRAAARAPRGRA